MIAPLGASAAARPPIRVGPTRQYKHPCAAILAPSAVHDGDVIEIDSTDANGEIRYDLDGNYARPMQCVVRQNHLTIRGADGQNPILNAVAASPNGKAIFDVKGNYFTAEHLTFQGATQAGCGASCTGIRMEGDHLTVRWCVFRHNNMGLLHTPEGPGHGGTDLIEHSDFYDNGLGDGQEHNVYINSAEKLIFRFNRSKCAHAGHLLKSRANESQVLYNLFQDDETCVARPGDSGQSSSLLNFPMGGRIYLIGNAIVGGARPDPYGGMITIGTEVLANYSLDPEFSEIFIVNNTILNRDVSTFSSGWVVGIACEGDRRDGTQINGNTRRSLPAGQTWLRTPVMFENNVIWRYPALRGWPEGGGGWNGGWLVVGLGMPPEPTYGCAGMPIYNGGGATVDKPILGTAGADSNWHNWRWDQRTQSTRWLSAGFQQVADEAARTALTGARLTADADREAVDVRLVAGSPLIDKGIDAGMAPTVIEDGVVNGRSLNPQLQYKSPCDYSLRPSDGRLDLGAYEFSDPASARPAK
jgi:hypothetical protein